MSKGGNLNQFMTGVFSETTSQMNEIIDKFNNEDYGKHDIKVNGGILRIIVEDGVPRITYLTDDIVLVEMQSGNALTMYAIKRK